MFEKRVLRSIFWPRKGEVIGEGRQLHCDKLNDLLSSRLLSKNLKIKICRSIILPVVLYVCETWSLTLREERKLRVFENMVLGEYLDLGVTG